jgi:hypothetical protein
MRYINNQKSLREKTLIEKKFEAADRHLDDYLDKRITFEVMKQRIEKLNIK